jgi:hypothetical protein
MSSNAELDTWRMLWQERLEAPAAADLRDRVARETRRKRIEMAGSILVTILIGGWVIARAIASGKLHDVALAVESWIFIAVIWIGALWIDRGNWRPLADTTTGFVELTIRRCRSALAGVRFGLYLYLAQLAFILFWQFRYSGTEPAVLLTSWPVILLGWLGVPLLIAFAVWFTRRKRAELTRLLDVQRQLTD